MASATRADLEVAAVEYFRDFAEQLDAPRNYDPDDFDYQVGFDVEMHRENIALLDDELRSNAFSRAQAPARLLAGRIGVDFDALPDHLKLAVLQLAARAERELSELQVHRLSTPAKRFQHYDELFAGSLGSSVSSIPHRPPTALSVVGRSFCSASEEYQAKTAARGVGASHVTELERALKWLGEVVGPDTPLTAITPDVMKRFRDDLQRIDVRLRGRKFPFRQRLTEVREHQIAHQTALRYWRSVQGFFVWCHDERLVGDNPAAVAKISKPKGVKVHQPPPFSTAELQALMKVPLYAGYKSTKQVMAPGDCHIREGRWWSGILLMHTGLRAGELSQLRPSDFVFDAPIPHLLVRQTDEMGTALKSVKTPASIRSVPLHDNLLVLGLRQFVEGRAKRFPKDRLFREFRLGTKDRKSEGATRFWGDLLKKHGLWKRGRSTHVWRHSLVAFLREAGVANEDIGTVVGHAPTTQTAKYGQTDMLDRKKATIDRLDFGFDVVGAVGGPYDLMDGRLSVSAAGTDRPSHLSPLRRRSRP